MYLLILSTQIPWEPFCLERRILLLYPPTIYAWGDAKKYSVWIIYTSSEIAPIQQVTWENHNTKIIKQNLNQAQSTSPRIWYQINDM